MALKAKETIPKKGIKLKERAKIVSRRIIVNFLNSKNTIVFQFKLTNSGRSGYSNSSMVSEISELKGEQMSETNITKVQLKRIKKRMIKIKDKPQTAIVLSATGMSDTRKAWARGKIKMINTMANNKYKKRVITIGAIVK